MNWLLKAALFCVGVIALGIALAQGIIAAYKDKDKDDE